MLSTTKCILLFATLFGFACSTYAIKCYQCESLTSPKCGLKFEADDNLLIDCSRISPPRFLQSFVNGRLNATGCMKKTLETGIGNPQIVRTCYFGDISNKIAGCQNDPSLPHVNQLSCDVCTKDECNGAGSLAPIAVATVLLVALAKILS